ncbi:hypothetical protein OPV22_020106 [Ensete ventricosum]|uniref:Uncharacterized protein n=1 Tax=Ensete ventricosum TaxID=4639 RepID=A0AAV8QP16_ENSVE|nr:hypothetical protein OPV22_020106 [Ensete ventricosum]
MEVGGERSLESHGIASSSSLTSENLSSCTLIRSLNVGMSNVDRWIGAHVLTCPGHLHETIKTGPLPSIMEDT